MDQIVLERERKISDVWSRSQSPKFEFPGLPLAFICTFFKADCKLVTFTRLAFLPVLFMSKRWQYLLRICSTWLKLAQQHISWESSVTTLAWLFQNFRKTLTALDRNHPL